MTTKTKFAAALSALALAATLALPSTAEARGRGWAIGAGLLGAGIVVGSVFAATAQPVYVVGGSLPLGAQLRCLGQLHRHRKVCRHTTTKEPAIGATPRLPPAPICLTRPVPSGRVVLFRTSNRP